MSRADSLGDYRTRIYSSYVTARSEPVAPRSLTALARHMPYFRKLVREHCPSNRSARIVDLGCGYGRFVYALQQAGYCNVTGVDVSAEQVKAAEALGISGVEQRELCEALSSMAPQSLDMIICFDVIEHFTKSELIDLIDSVHRTLKRGGRWLIHVPNAESPFWGRVRYGDFTHEQAFTRESLAQLLLSSGFASVKCLEDRPVVHGVKSAVRAVLWHLIRAVLLTYVAVEDGALSGKSLFSQNMLAVAIRE